MDCIGGKNVLSKPKYWKISNESTKALICPVESDCLGGYL